LTEKKLVVASLNKIEKMKNLMLLATGSTLLLMLVFTSCKKKGCTDELAINYFEAVKKDDGSCSYSSTRLEGRFSYLRNNDTVSDTQTCNGIKFLMDKNKVTTFEGLGSFVDSTTVEIKGNDGKSTQIKSKNIIIATGSKPNFFPGMEPDKKRIITSTEALNLKEIPKKMIVIGGGVIGLELGSVYSRLGSEVEVVEFASSIIPTMDETMGKELTRILKKEGFIYLNLSSVI